ncbi:HAD family hydrolase [Paenibacillus beijingensis]|uniref:HAD family hydrolase n=1 Tax=Paenibacillus beijingensis TaxID=1126833 RepID=A0A0D5NQ31_9BACL|nr:HAD family hydrolase [Paenibacillus beijingensis]AJY77043.1 HAD family hydrolase [Paenibacillus beijingensis]
MKQTIVFDLDDTLIHCNKYFNLVIDQFVDAMTTWFKGYPDVTADSVRDKQTEIDIAGVQLHGFKSDHFPQSFLDTYSFFCEMTGRKPSPLETDLLWKMGLSVYEQEAEPYPDMEATLDKLAGEGHHLHLYTGGEPLIQQRKIDHFQLERYFGDRIYIRRHKNSEALEEILQQGGFDRPSTWMIGNSIRTDVVPALTTGIHAIHVQTEKEWLFNVVSIDVEPKGAFLTLNHLRDVPSAINDYIGR